MNFLDIDCSFDEAKFIVVPAKIGGTSVGLKGAENAPEYILRASWQIEDWDTELKFDFTTAGIHTTKPVYTFDELYFAIREILRKGKIPITIGGEHSITHVILKAMSEKYEKLSGIFFDAHADMFDEFGGNKFSHACALYLSLPYLRDFVAIGIRNISKRELQNIEKLELKSKFIFLEDVIKIEDGITKIKEDEIERKIQSLQGAVYLSFDFDFIDPAYLPSLSTPEPPGFSFFQTFFILRKIISCFGKNIVGMDFVEFCPQGIFASDVSAAKVIAKSIAYLSYYCV